MAAPDFGKMIGPLPMGAWLIVVAGGLGIALYTRRQGTDQITDPDLMPEDTGTTPGVGTGGSGQWIDLNPPPPNAGDAPPTTNEEWSRRAIDRMIGMGYPADIVNSGIAKFMAQEKVSAHEFSVVKEALRILGSPPFPVPGPFLIVPPVVVPKPPPPKPKPVPSGYTKHTVQRGQTMAIIAQFYKTNPSSVWRANFAGLKRADGSIGWVTWFSDVQKYAGTGRYLVIPNAIKNQVRTW